MNCDWAYASPKYIKMKYEFAPDLQEITEEIAKLLFLHVDMSRVKCFRSFGSSSKRTIARCHTIGKLMQNVIGIPAYYGIEFLSKQFDRLSEKEKIETIIHELMHIPKSFGGGFRHHDWVCDKNVKLHYETYMSKKIQSEKAIGHTHRPLPPNGEIRRSWFFG